MTSAHRLRILHLSDLHERVGLDWMKPERQALIRARAASRRRVLVESNFEEIIKGMRQERAFDLVFITGDVAARGHGSSPGWSPTARSSSAGPTMATGS
jgi:hypothetical protein